MRYKYLIDSSAWVEYFDATPTGKKIKNIIEQEPIATSMLAISELADRYRRKKKDFTPCLSFIESRAEILPVTIGLCTWAAEQKEQERKHSKKFSLIDGFHLATAWLTKTILITTDKDFAKAKNVLLLDT